MIVAATETITIADITGAATAEAPDFSYEAAKRGSGSSAIEGESMRNCVDAALTLFDKIRQAPGSGASGSAGGSPPTARP